MAANSSPAQDVSLATPGITPVKRNHLPVILIAILLAILIFVNIILLIINNGNLSHNSDNVPVSKAAPTLSTPIITQVPTSAVYPGRLVITSPLSGSSLLATGGTLLISGQMQGFFEGVLNFKLLNTNNIELYRNSLTTANNYNAFAPFSQSFTIPAVPAANRTSTVKLVFYEVSQKDGSESDLLTVDLALN